MSKYNDFLKNIRDLIAKDDFKAAIQHLSALLKDSPLLDEAVQQSARYNNVVQQIRLGLVDFESATITKNQIRYGVLELLREVEEQTQQNLDIKVELERFGSFKNIIQNSTINAGGNFRIGDDHITYINNYFAEKEVEIPRRLTNNIPTNADHILGRENELTLTKEYLAKYQNTVLFNGIGGIGKTALASKYMANYGSEYKHLAWITVHSTLAEAFINNEPLLVSLQITNQVHAYIEAKQLDKAFDYLFHQLNLLENTLVVIDNANNLEDLDQYKNWFDTATCHFLITSRSQPPEWVAVEVDTLPENEAVALFRMLSSPFLGRDAVQDKDIKKLLSKLFYHTLLIELVAKAGAANGISFTDLLTMLDTQFIHHQSLNEAPISTGKHGSVVATNLRKARIESYIFLIFNQLNDLDESSKCLLQSMALLPTATLFDFDFLKIHFDFFKITNAIVCLDILTERGWLQREQTEERKPSFKMHPLIADMVVEHLGVDQVYASNYIKNISNIMKYDNSDPDHNLFEIMRYEILAIRLVDLFFNSTSNEVAYLFHCLGGYYRELGFLEKAVEYGSLALKKIESLPDAEKILIPAIYNNLGLAFKENGQYSKATELLEKALIDSEIQCGEENLIVATRQSNLAAVYQLQGRLEEASFLLKKSLAIEEKENGPQSPRLIKCLNNLAFVYQSSDKHAESVILFERSLKIAQVAFNENHPNITLCQAGLASAYNNIGRYKEAIVLLEQALDFDLNFFGINHPHVGNHLFYLAQSYIGLKNYKEAVNLFEKVLSLDRLNLGEEHPNVAIAENNLAFIYLQLGNKAKAYELWLHAYKVCVDTWGETHPNSLTTKQMLDFLSSQNLQVKQPYLLRLWSNLFKS